MLIKTIFPCNNQGEVARLQRAAGQGAQLANQAGAALQSLLGVVEQTADEVNGMARSAATMQSAARQAKVSEENAAVAEEVSASTEELTASAEAVAASAAHLKQIADRLQGQVSQFKV